MAFQRTNVGHAAGIFADMSVDGPPIGTLVAVVDRAKNLPNRKTMGKQNPYCAARLGKEAQKTGTDLRGGQTPKWDQELRFTVHESPDYTRLKLSVFNDDKRTDMIGETWIDLQGLIIPGGSQSDQWHTLQFRGKYAGEIRLEMTYYDTRPEDEAVIERRTQGAERTVKSSSSRVPAAVAPSPAPSSSSSLSGPRQQVKRRPLPEQRPAPEKAYSAPAPVPHTRPAPMPTPPSSAGMDYAPRYAAPPSGYDAPRPRTYETPDDFQQNWNQPVQHSRRQGYPQDPYAPEYYATRPRSGYDNAPPADYRNSHYGYQQEYAYDDDPRYVSSMSSRHRLEYPSESERRRHAEYAAMQPSVEDEEEEGPPPPPPVHRSGLAHPTSQLVPSPTPSYKAYSPEYGPRSTHDMSIPQPTELMLDLPPATSAPSMPPSLVAGLDPVVADAESERVNEARRRSQIFEEDLPRRGRDPSPVSLPYPDEFSDSRSIISRKSIGEVPTQQLVLRKSVSPRPPISRGRERSHSQIPFSPDSFDSYNPRASRSAVVKDPEPAYKTPAESMAAARRNEAAATRENCPIIGDDGKEIDPSDHLPTDTWAPEPERKSRKPGVIVRFRNAPPRAAPRVPAAPPKERPTSSYMSTPDSDYNRGRQGFGGSVGTRHGRSYSTSPHPQPQPRRHSISPAPSPMYAPPPNIGPPIPAKVPIGAPTVHGRDALSRELSSIDIGGVGFSSSRTMRKYVPRPTGYAM
ncbi:hypothetical protein BDV18DRAFT_157714 [Aspergillus unguis]